MYRIYYSCFRGCVIRRFPFTIFYSIEDKEIIVHSIFDNRQNPNKKPWITPQTSEEWYDLSMTQLYAFEWDYDAFGNRTYQEWDTQETYYTYDETGVFADSYQTKSMVHVRWSQFEVHSRNS